MPIFFIKCTFTAPSDGRVHGLYTIWQSICFLWAPDGPIIIGAPISQLGVYKERQAALLTQHNIDKERTTLDQYLM